MVKVMQQGMPEKNEIQRIYRGEVGEAVFRNPYLQKVNEVFCAVGKRRRVRKALLRLLRHTARHADLFGMDPAVPRLGPRTGNTFIEGMAELARNYRNWILPVEDWWPEDCNSAQRFGSLTRHLLAKYDVPAFMDTVWFLGDRKDARQQQGWFKHIGIGQNIRTADVPVHLSKKMAHFFMQAPANASVEEALRWGQVLGMGGNKPLARAVNGTRLATAFENEDFWRTVIRFLVNHPMLDPEQVGPIVDYIHNQKYAPQEEIGPRGAVIQRSPPQPDFSMKGRSMIRLLQQMETWHQALGQNGRRPLRQWPASGIGALTYTEQGEHGKARWAIQELLTAEELAAEGYEMRHCVLSYAVRCQTGACSIWSMRVGDSEGAVRRVLTISVDNSHRRIMQVRGKYNALPDSRKPLTENEWRLESSYRDFLRRSQHILSLWRKQEGLTLGEM